MKAMSKRMRLTEKVTHILRKRKMYRVLVWRSKHLGGPQVKWERNIKICMLKYGRA